MKLLTRRDAVCLLGMAGLASAMTPAVVLGRAKFRVVVIGGGPGGATVAKYLAQASAGIEVILVTGSQHYFSPFYSNPYLAGLLDYRALRHGYGNLRDRYGIKVVPAYAKAIDPARSVVRLTTGEKLSYDRLVVAPGIDFKENAIAGYNREAAAVMPHAWRGGSQLKILRRQLEAMPDGGLFLLAAPASPYRCPPAPYERVSLVAHYLTKHKPRSKILILDAKNGFPRQSVFMEAWARRYGEMVEWLPADFIGPIRAVNASAGEVITAGETFRPQVANIIPPQQAGMIARQTGLADESGWCPIHPATLESTRVPGIHVVGDSIRADRLAKSASSANSQAKVCAMAILAALGVGKKLKPKFQNVCWSLLGPGEAIRMGGDYEVQNGGFSLTRRLTEERANQRAAMATEVRQWYGKFSQDVFASTPRL